MTIKGKVPVPMLRLTLTAEAFAMALMHSKPMAGRAASRRLDNKWDVLVTEVTYHDIKKAAKAKEDFSDTVIRLLKVNA